MSIQKADGSFQGGLVGSKPDTSVSFDTGQILLGFSRGVQELSAKYLEPLRKAADWMVTTQESEGYWCRFPPPRVAPGQRTYQTHIALALLEAGKVTANDSYVQAAIKNVNWAIGIQHDNGWFPRCFTCSNILVNIASGSNWNMAAAFVLGHSYGGEPTQSAGNLIAHNTVYECASPIAILDPTHDIAPQELNRIVNNVFVGCGFRSRPPSKPVAVTESSGCFSCPENQGSGGTTPEALPPCNSTKGDLLGNDPGLRDPSGGDFYLRFDSPLRGAGTPVPEVITDRAGNPRPTSGRPAIGAYEYMLGEPKALHIE